MPVIPNLVLTNQLPIKTYTASLVVSASSFEGHPSYVVADGLGNQIGIMEVTCSYAFSASVQQTYELSSSWASASMWATSASFTSRSFSATSASWTSASFVSTTASYASSSGWSVSSSFASTSFSATSASFASQSLTSAYSSYVSASVVAGGVTGTEYIIGGSPWTTMSFVNGILTVAT